MRSRLLLGLVFLVGCGGGGNVEFEPNDNPNQAKSVGTPTPDPITVAAAISPVGDVDFFKFTLPATADVKLETFDKTGTACKKVDTRLELIGPNGVDSLANNDDVEPFVNTCSLIDPTTSPGARSLPPGDYFAKVTAVNETVQIAAYQIKISVVALCGNGAVEGSEACDDGNLVNGDGCEDTCRGAVSDLCGNGLTDPNEECDDGNLVNGDGCDSTCQDENPVVVSCGNGATEGNEQCDDGNTANGDGCNAGCLNESGHFGELEPNDGTGLFQFKDVGIPDVIIHGSIDPAADLDVYRFTVPAAADVRIEVFDGNPNLSGCFNVDSAIELIAPDGTTLLASDDEDSVAFCSVIDSAIQANAKGLTPGDYFVRIREFGQDEIIENYQIRISFNALCSDNVVEGGEICDDGNTLSGDGCDATCQDEFCGDGILNDSSEECDDSNTVSGDGCDSLCQNEFCGDNIVNDINEECDDGNLTNGDGCDSACVVESVSCGNGATEGAEQCDDGNITNGDGCNSSCLNEPGHFGELEPNNGTGLFQFKDVGSPDITIHGSINPENDVDFYRFTVPARADLRIEAFDNTGVSCVNIDTTLTLLDENNTTLASNDENSNSFCSTIDSATQAGARALPPGNYFVRIAEFGQDLKISYQLRISFNALCGDSTQEGSEQCDDNNAVAGDGCNSCVLEFCGDGLDNNGSTEECDDGNNTNGDGCDSLCKIEFCGDGLANNNEECDDNNAIAGDGCNSCVLEFCGDGLDNNGANEECDDGNNTDGDGCNSLCEDEFCGDGVDNDGDVESCDDGNTTAGDGCDFCVDEFCGDALINDGIAEQCDDGNIASGDGCSAQCQIENPCGDGNTDPGEECDDGKFCDKKQCSNGVVCAVNAACAGIGDGLCLNRIACITDAQCTNVAAGLCSQRNGDGCNNTCQNESGHFGELEPNNGTGLFQFKEVSPDVNIHGSIIPAGDVDVYGINLPSTSDVKIEVFDSNVGVNCANIDTTIELFVLDPVTGDEIILAADDESSTNFCSIIDPATNIGSRSLQAGFYFIRIAEFGRDLEIPRYQLSVSFSSVCGDNIVEGSEACDDGGTTPEDGCDENCQVELGNFFEIEPNNGAEAKTVENGLPDVLVHGVINPAGDVDNFRINLTAPTTIRLRTFDANGGPVGGNCVGIDTVILLFQVAFDPLTAQFVPVPTLDPVTGFQAGDDDSGIFRCSDVTFNFPAGSHLIQVSDFGNDETIDGYTMFIDFP